VRSPERKEENERMWIMKKLVFVLTALLLAVPAMANVTISCSQIGHSAEFKVSYNATEDGNLPRGLGLNISVDNDANITDLQTTNADYWVYPGDINIVDGNVVDQGSPVVGTLPTSSIIVEMGSLHYPTGPEASNPNAPGLTGDLVSFKVSDDCNVTITTNSERGGVVNYAAGQADTTIVNCDVSPICCPLDQDNDGDYDLDDYNTMKGKLNYANYLTSEYLVEPGDPNTGFLWDGCCDGKTQDNDIDLDDYNTLKGKLNYAKYLTDEYRIVPDDPCDPNANFLWDCP
jgi:hypothetical protein